MENVCLCGRATKYQCIRCETTVCVLCASEIQNPEDEPEYMPMSKVGICNQCNNTAIAGCRVETDDESVVLEDMEASNDTGQFSLTQKMSKVQLAQSSGPLRQRRTVAAKVLISKSPTRESNGQGNKS